jgi:hypothetical protein
LGSGNLNLSISGSVSHRRNWRAHYDKDAAYNAIGRPSINSELMIRMPSFGERSGIG